jgi:hypothetical protein
LGYVQDRTVELIFTGSNFDMSGIQSVSVSASQHSPAISRQAAVITTITMVGARVRPSARQAPLAQRCPRHRPPTIQRSTRCSKQRDKRAYNTSMVGPSRLGASVAGPYISTLGIPFVGHITRDDTRHQAAVTTIHQDRDVDMLDGESDQKPHKGNVEKTYFLRSDQQEQPPE